MERRTPPPTPRTGSRLFYNLEGFARLFLQTRSIKTWKDVRTEDLTEAFRQHMKLPAFPTEAALVQLAHDLEIELRELPKGSSAPRMNISYGSANALLLASGLPKTYRESTIGHETRELIERAFQRVSPQYMGLDTADNKQMHGESEHFALCLLMQGDATHQRLCEIGFDLVRFAQERGRSLPSVIRRAQNLYAANSTRPGPVAGFWLYEASSPRGGSVAPKSLRVRHTASLCGFSTAKTGSAYAKRANLLFPCKDASAAEYPVALRAAEERQPQSEDVPLADLFGEENYFVVAEPLLRAGQVQRVVITAVRRDCLGLVEPWLGRLGLKAA